MPSNRDKWFAVWVNGHGDLRWIVSCFSLLTCLFTLRKIHKNKQKNRDSKSLNVDYYIRWVLISIIQRCLGRFPSTYRSNIILIYCWQSWMESCGGFTSFQLLVLLIAMPYVALFHFNRFDSFYIKRKRFNIFCIHLISMFLSVVTLYVANFGSLNAKFDCSSLMWIYTIFYGSVCLCVIFMLVIWYLTTRHMTRNMQHNIDVNVYKQIRTTLLGYPCILIISFTGAISHKMFDFYGNCQYRFKSDGEVPLFYHTLRIASAFSSTYTLMLALFCLYIVSYQPNRRFFELINFGQQSNKLAVAIKSNASKIKDKAVKIAKSGEKYRKEHNMIENRNGQIMTSNTATRNATVSSANATFGTDSRSTVTVTHLTQQTNTCKAPKIPSISPSTIEKPDIDIV